jgi:hypothetical protein
MRREELQSVNKMRPVPRVKKPSHGTQDGASMVLLSPAPIQTMWAPCSYSIRSACMGDIEAARLAGMMAAKNEQTASAPAATDSANGSQEETP